MVGGAAPVEEKEQQIGNCSQGMAKEKETLRGKNRESTVHLKVNWMTERRGVGMVLTIVGVENGCTGIVEGCGEECNVGSDEGRE